MIRVLLQCDDTYFVQAFSNYASTYCQNMEFYCFSTPEKALNYLSSTALRLDAVLAERVVLDEVSLPRIAKLEIAERTVYSDLQQIRINIYQSGPSILSDIRNALALSGNHSLRGREGRAVQVVAAYSTQGGSGKTTVSYALAVTAARSGKQALYLNLEPYPTFGQLYEYQYDHSMDDLLFALKGTRDLVPVLLDAIEHNQDGVSVLPPFHSAGDLLSLTQDNLKELLSAMVEKTDLDYIFLDLSVGFQQLNLWALEEATCVLQIYTDTAAGRERMKRAQEDIYYQNLSIEGTAHNVLNKCRQKGAEENIIGKLPLSDSMQQERRIADVLERNPSFLKSCADLLDKMQ